MAQQQKTILHVFPSLEIGGSQRRLATLINEGHTTHKHMAIALNGDYASAVTMPTLECMPDVGPDIPKGQTLKALKIARSHLECIKPDLLVTYNWGSVEWAMSNRFRPICPMVHIQDGFGPEEQSHEILLRRLFRALIYSGCAKVIFPSHTLEKIAKKSWRISDQALEFIPNGVDLKRFSGPTDDRLIAAYGFQPSDIIIGTVAALRPEKNIGRLIEAFYYASDNIPNARLLIIGDGPMRPALQMLIERTSVSKTVILAGPLDNPEAILPRLRAFALSSDTEQMPLSVIEAMVAGLPIASTDVGDIKNMVSPVNKPFINGKDDKALSHSLRQLLLQGATAAEIGKANADKANQNYSHTAMIKRYEATFDRVMGND